MIAIPSAATAKILWHFEEGRTEAKFVKDSFQ
jgi:hypothetical protein